MRYEAQLMRAICLSTLFLFACSGLVGADLVGFWNFDDETADDLSGNGNDGILNGVEFSDDVPNGSGQSLEVFSNTSVQVPHSDSLDINDSMTIAYWMRADNVIQAANWNGPMSKTGGEPRLGWEFQRFDDQSRIDLRVDTTEGENSVRGNLTGTYDDEWVHVAWTVDEGEIVSFLDGELVDVSLYPHGDGFSNPDVDFSIGCRGDNWCVFDGLLDEIGIWNSVLSDDEIADLASGMSPIDPPPTTPGDYNEDGMVDATDVDLQSAEMKKDPANQDLATFDHNNDDAVTVADRLIWVKELRKTWVGDSNLDDEFNSSDLVKVFTDGLYETGQMAAWGSGDWDGNMSFDSSDLVFAFTDGGYELGPQPAVAAVPEPTGITLLTMAFVAISFVRHRHRRSRPV